MNDTIRAVQSGDVTLSVRVIGRGPLVILMHGWPELGLSWRHQIGPLADAGFTVAAPDMRGYGSSSSPAQVDAYSTDAICDDMLAIADALGAKTWIAVGHDWGSPVAWRCALRFPHRVSGVFSLSVPHGEPPPPTANWFQLAFPDVFFYIRYFQEVGLPEAELEKDPKDSLKRIFHSLSGDAPLGDWLTPRPIDGRLLDGLDEPPPGELTFLPDSVLDEYARAFARRGFFGPVSWYRNIDTNSQQARAYGSGEIAQPAGFLCGSKEIVLAMNPAGLDAQRALVPNLRMERVLPGAGHWIQQERPAEVTEAILEFLTDVAS